MTDDKNFLYRYPGTKPFESNEYELFKGRDEDIDNLYELISLQNLIVLFGRSGLGKSSLLNAGLVNRFKIDPSIVPVFIRFGAYYDKNTITPLEKLRSTVSDRQYSNATNFIFEKLIPEEEITVHRLWYFFKRFQIAKADNQKFILIFDQFEELFTYPENVIDLFKKELSELLYVSVPQQLRNLLKDKLLLDPSYLTKEEKDLLFSVLNIKILFSIRSDKLSLLNKLTDYFPSVLKLCYELKPLNKHQAHQAIEEPAKLDDKDYVSPPFGFTEEALTLILNSLTAIKVKKEDNIADGKPEIETFQLQIICKYAENLVIENGVKQISASDLGNIKEIFENHYRNIIAKLSTEKQLPARRLIEEKLIIEGSRVSMPVPFILRDEGMTKELLDELINTHILRREQNNTVEISHDTLIEPILKYYDERKKQEAIESELREKEEQIKRIREEQKIKAKRNRLIIAIVGVALILTLGLAAYALIQSKEAEKQKVIAIQKSREAEKQEKNAIEQKTIANYNALKAFRAQELSDSSAKIAYINAKKAKSEQIEAITQKRKISVQYNAFRLNALAQEWSKEDPTVALRLEEAAIQKNPDPIIIKAGRQIYSQHAFYKIILKDSFSNFFPYAISPDGTKILIGCSDKIVRLWNLNAVLLKEFIGLTGGGITSVAFSPDGKKIILGSWDQTVILWSIDGKLITKFKGRGAVNSVAFSPDGTKILSGSRDSVELSNLDGTLIKEFKGSGDLNSIAFSPDGTKILVGGFKDNTARLWDLNGNLENEFRGHKSSVSSVAFSPDGTKILTGSWDNTAILWELKYNLPVKVFEGHKGPINSVAFSPDGTKILTGSWDKTGRLWNLDGTLVKELRGHKGSITSVTFSHDGTKAFTCSADSTVRLWVIEYGTLLKEFKGHTNVINAVTFSPDGKKILTSSEDNNTTIIWDIAGNGNLLNSFTVPTGLGGFPPVAFSSDRKKILTGSLDSTVRLWSAEGTLLREFKGNPNFITSVALSQDGKKILAMSKYEMASLWSIEGTLLKRFKINGDATSAVFSPDGKKILSVPFGGETPMLWSLDGTLIKQYKGHSGVVESIAFSPDGKKIVTGSRDNVVSLWEIDGALLKEFKVQGGMSGILAIAFSPDGKKIVTGSGKNAALWDIEDDILLREFKSEGGEISAIAFSPDGTKILTGSRDNEARLWDNSATSLEQFLHSDKIEPLTEQQKKEFGIK